MEIRARAILSRGGCHESEHEVRVSFVSLGESWELPPNWKSVDDDAGNIIFPRSAVKFFQALPLVTTGAADHFRLEPRHLALASASHVGLPIHTETVLDWLTRIGLSVTALHCGVHAPVDPGTAADLLRRGEKPSSLHHNCSGKHTGVLTTCVYRGEPISDYEDLLHPAQLRIRHVLEIFSGEKLSDSHFAVDGCSMPAVRMKLSSLALAGARLAQVATSVSARSAANEGEDSEKFKIYGSAAARVFSAIQQHPEYLGGGPRICTQIIQLTHGRVIVKTGAEGVFLVVVPSEQRAFAVKSADGGMRATVNTVVEILSQLQYLKSEDLARLGPFLLAQTFDIHHRMNSELKVLF